MSTDKHWGRWGEVDPYYAVVTHERFRKDKLTAVAMAEFFRTGELHVEQVFSTIKSYIRPAFAPESALDFGCGAGRIVIPLAEYCQVTGVDISPGMLHEAEKNAQSRGVSNLRLASVVDDGPYDIVHSYLVFQHIPVSRGLRLTERLLDVLAPNGIAVLHYAYRTEGSAVRRLVSRGAQRLPGVRHAFNAVRGREIFDPPMEMIPYPLPKLLALFYDRGFTIGLVRQSDDNGVLGAMFYLWRSG
jgi:SAM-dependent methyltransferase